MSAHTPGPWYHEVGVVYGPNEDGTGFAVDNPADAPLIAAAPDLLDACTLALAVFEDCDEYDQEPALTMRAAIAKATGKEGK